jgi:hypothetical protein
MRGTGRNRGLTRFTLTYQDTGGRVGIYGILEEWGGQPPTPQELRQALRYAQGGEQVIKEVTSEEGKDA